MEQKNKSIQDISAPKQKDAISKSAAIPTKPNARYQRDKMREPVRGIFKFDEAPGQTLSFMYREFKEDPIERFDLADGQVHTIPLGVARHINKNMNYPVHSYLKDDQGNATMRVGRKNQRASFQSLEFVDIDDMEPDNSGIVTVERI